MTQVISLHILALTTQQIEMFTKANDDPLVRLFRFFFHSFLALKIERRETLGDTEKHREARSGAAGRGAAGSGVAGRGVAGMYLPRSGSPISSPLVVDSLAYLYLEREFLMLLLRMKSDKSFWPM